MNDIETIAEHYGLTHQLMKLIEEMEEVTNEICKLLLATEDKVIEDIYHNTLPSELADLSAVYSQVIYLMDNKDKVAENRKYKVERQLERIGKEVSNE